LLKIVTKRYFNLANSYLTYLQVANIIFSGNIFRGRTYSEKSSLSKKQKSLSMGMGFITLVEQLATEIAHF